MPIKAIVDTLDDVPEQYRDLYTEKSGRFEITGIEGMKSQADIDRLSSALEKERKDHKSVREKFSFLADRDTNEVQQMLDKYPELQALAESKGMDDAALQKLVEARLASTTAPMKRELDKLKADLQERDSKLSEYQTRETTRTIHDALREAIVKQKGFRAEAEEDAKMFAERMLEVNEQGKVVTRDGVGVTPGLDAGAWLLDMQQRKPHWWGDSVGGGASGGQGGNNGGTNPWSAEGWNMTEQGKIMRENRSRAESLAKQAGTTIGGLRPQPRK